MPLGSENSSLPLLKETVLIFYPSLRSGTPLQKNSSAHHSGLYPTMSTKTVCLPWYACSSTTLKNRSDLSINSVSGFNRGISLGLVSQLAARPNTLVFAGVRDPTKAEALDALSANILDRLWLFSSGVHLWKIAKL